MRLRRAFTAAATAAAISFAGMVVPGTPLPEAGAAVNIAGTTASFAEPRVSGSINQSDGIASIMFNDPLAGGELPTNIEGRVYINGSAHKADLSMTVEGNNVVLKSVDQPTGVEVKRTYKFGSGQVELEVEMRNPSSGAVQMQVDLMHSSSFGYPRFSLVEGATPMIARSANPDYDITVDFTGNPQATGFSDGSPGWADAPYGRQGTKAKKGPLGAGNNGRLQAGRWFAPLNTGETFTGSIVVTATPPPEKGDADGDGIPDEWETNGFIPAGYNERLDLRRWGATPNRPDIFLQLNWMKPEVEQECRGGGSYARTPRGFSSFRDCIRADTNPFRPSKETLQELVELFKANGYNLHIDAGEWFNNINASPWELRGGPTVDYQQYYFPDGKSDDDVLLEARDRYLGARKSVFRLGVIGDTIAPGDFSSGVGSTPGGSFFVAKSPAMTNEKQLRNTILHELGHNLGLSHAGTIKVQENRSKNYMPNYRSTMNYLYQFSHFGFTSTESRSTSMLPPECYNKPCYRGSYRVPPDWTNLTLDDGTIGRASGRLDNPPALGTDDHVDHPSTRELEVNAAVRNNGKAGFRLPPDTGPDSGIVRFRNDNKIVGELSNLGRREHTFTVETTFGTGPVAKVDRQTITVPGIPEGTAAEDMTTGKVFVDIPVSFPEGFNSTGLPASIRVTNSSGEEQYMETHNLIVLDYNESEAKQVLNQILRSSADEKDKEAARKLLDPAVKRNGPDTTANAEPSKPTTGQQVPGSGSSSGSSGSSASDTRNTGVIAGVFVGLIAAVLGALGFAWAQNQG